MVTQPREDRRGGGARRHLHVVRTSLTADAIGSDDAVRAHVFLCMFAYYVEWHMRGKLAPLLFEDDDPGGTLLAKRASPVARAEVSDRAMAKARSTMTADGFPAHSFTTLFSDLALNEAAAPATPEHRFPVFAQPTPLQSRASDLSMSATLRAFTLNTPAKFGAGHSQGVAHRPDPAFWRRMIAGSSFMDEKR